MQRGVNQLSFSNLYNDIINRQGKISLIGLGYVGMPIAVSFSRKVDVIGFDAEKTNWNNKAEIPQDGPVHNG